MTGNYQYIPTELQCYIENEILPQYQHFDAAHQRDHALMVIRQSLELAQMINDGRIEMDGVSKVSVPMVYVIAAYHDLGLAVDRKTHHLHSGQKIRQDKQLLRWFTSSEVGLMAQAVEDHRASAKTTPRSIYGKIVSEADRYIVAESIVERTIQYGLDNYADLDREGQWKRTIEHLKKKYGYGGYLRLWFSEGANYARLKQLQQLISEEESKLRMMFDKVYDMEIERRNSGNSNSSCHNSTDDVCYNSVGNNTNITDDTHKSEVSAAGESVYESEAWRQMTSGEPYDATQSVLVKELIRVRSLIARYNNTDPSDLEGLSSQLNQLLGRCGKNVCIVQPFRCDYGKNIFIGDDTYVNFNLTVLDEAKVSIGKHCFIGPNVSIYTPCHPLTPDKRNTGQEWSREVVIGDNCWFGGNVVVLPGVHIGNNVVIGAGSVVTKDVPDNEVWAGNPAKFIKTVELE